MLTIPTGFSSTYRLYPRCHGMGCHQSVSTSGLLYLMLGSLIRLYLGTYHKLQAYYKHVTAFFVAPDGDRPYTTLYSIIWD